MTEYERLSNAILDEHRQVFEKQDQEELASFMDTLIDAQRIFVLGVGREGIALRSFAMRLMHLGKEVHWIWDDTTPGLGAGDVLLVSSGSGEIGHIDYVSQKALRNGAKLAVVTGTPKGATPQKADVLLFVPASVYKGTDPRVVPSVQPMGNLYEQHMFLLFDLLIMLMEQKLEISHADMEARHRNVE